MYYNLQKPRATYNLNLPNLNSQFFFHSSLLIDENLRSRIRSSRRSSFRSSLGSKLRRKIFLPLGLLLIPFYSSHALTVKTSNTIQGNEPYLTFDGGRTRALNIEALLGITLSDGKQYTTKTNTSSPSNPIELPVAGQSFADIDMIFPTNVDLIA
ncbi:hypothetical protein, partial [Gilliamella sp. B2911]